MNRRHKTVVDVSAKTDTAFQLPSTSSRANVSLRRVRRYCKSAGIMRPKITTIPANATRRPTQGTGPLFWRKSACSCSLANAGNVGTVISKLDWGNSARERKAAAEITASATLLMPHDHK